MLLRYIGHENVQYLRCCQGTSENTATLSMSVSRITQAASAWQRESKYKVLSHIPFMRIGFQKTYHFGWSNWSKVTGPLELPCSATALQQDPAYGQRQYPKPLPATGRDDPGTKHQPKTLHSNSDVLVKSASSWMVATFFQSNPFASF